MQRAKKWHYEIRSYLHTTLYFHRTTYIHNHNVTFHLVLSGKRFTHKEGDMWESVP